MFYLSKRIGNLINAFHFQRTSSRVELRVSKLGFLVDFSGVQDLIEQMNGLVPKAIVKRGNEYAYFVGSGLERITRMEEGYAEKAKSAVIEEISARKEEINMKLFSAAREIAERELLKTMGKERAGYLSYIIAHDTVGYGPISVLLEDKALLEEIEINAPCSQINVYHTAYGRCSTNLRFASEAQFRHSINRFIYDTDKELDENSPIIDAQVEDARIHAQIKPYALSGAVASIRLASSKIVGPDYLVRKGTTNFEVLAYLWLAMDAKENVIVAGSPASGKTTLMSALFAFVPRAEKTITIEEDVNELKAKIDINNTVALCGSRYGNGISTREQVINSLRMRPERLVVGEIRGGEAMELFAGANLGVPFITTMHSNSGGLDIVKKLMAKPMGVETRSLSMLDIGIYMKQTDLTKRLLSDVYEYKWLSREETESTDVRIEESDSVEVMNIISDGRLASELLMNSKVIGAFSRKRNMQKKMVLKELVKRAEFLRVIGESCKNAEEMLEKIQGYDW